MESLLKILDSKTGQALGVSVVFIFFFWLSWNQNNLQNENRISKLEADVVFFQQYVEKEQEQRETLFVSMEKLFSGIESHLAELTKRRPVTKN